MMISILEFCRMMSYMEVVLTLALKLKRVKEIILLSIMKM